MTVVGSAQSVIHPGRWKDALGLASEVSKLLGRHGARATRYMAASTAGEATATCVFSAEYDNMEAFGAASDGLIADQDLRSIIERSRGPASPVTVTGQSILTELPLERTGNRERGNYVEVHISRVTPGRGGELLETARDVADFVEARGATNAQLGTIGAAGSFTGAVSMSWEFPSMRALGKLADMWLSDPAGLAIYESSMSAHPATTEIFSGIYQVIPI
ncbi:MAG TPA: hypothetical protein VF441_07615 [Acidimicrobiia bacterium]